MSFARINGQDLFYAESGEGAPIIFGHGIAGSHDVWEPVTRQLQDRFRCILTDFRGAGDSNQAKGPCTIAQFAFDVVGLADHLGLATFTYAGFSLGATVGMQLGIASQDRLDKLILTASPSADAEVRQVMRELRKKGDEAAMLARLRAMAVRDVSDEVLRARVRSLVNTSDEPDCQTRPCMMALTLTSEAAHLRSAQDIVSTEAAQASRLAWAATSPNVDTAPIQVALTDYLRATRAREWRGVGQSERADPSTARAIATLERTVRAAAASPAIGTPASTELLAALDAVTSARRERLAAASRELPVLYVLTLVVSGIALVVNAGTLTFRSSVRTSLLVVGLALVVALSLALLFALSGPWEGPLIVNGQPIDTVVRDLHAGFFGS